MKAWLESLVGPDYAAALLWTIVALIVLLVLLIAIRIVRGLSVGTFVAGGRNRKARLAVMDATAVDSHRRLVLVRRDDVEHLILIGGPTDVVVEQNIRLSSPARRPAAEDAHAGHGHLSVHDAASEPERLPAPAREQAREQPAIRPAPAPVQHRPAPAATAAPKAAAVSAPPPPRPGPNHQQAMPASPPVQPHQPSAPASAAAGVQPMRPVVAPSAATEPAAPRSYAPAPKAEAGRGGDLDDALLKELEVSLDKELPGSQPQRQAAAPRPAAPSVDDALDAEMSKLLRDLAGKQ